MTIAFFHLSIFSFNTKEPRTKINVTLFSARILNLAVFKKRELNKSVPHSKWKAEM